MVNYLKIVGFNDSRVGWMAFFRKTKKTEDVLSDIKAKAESESHQTKWDALERMIREGHDAPHTDTAKSSPATPSEFDSKTDAPDLSSLDVNAYKTQSAGSGTISPELKIDLPNNSNFVDVTPQTEVESVAAMLPSNHFERTASKEEATSSRGTVDDQDLPRSKDGFVPPPPATNRAMRADIGSMRLDVARISADIQSGEELYRRAQQRIENLTGFVERAEVDFSLLNRLEPENRRLKARNRTIEREIEASAQKMNVLRAELEDREQRLAEKTRVYENTLGKLSVAKKSLQEYERALNTSRENADRNALKSERLQTSLDVERRENEVLRERITETSADMDVKQTAYIEAKKIADSLAQDCADYRHQAESVEKEADELRRALATAQTQNNAMKAEMLSLHEDIRTFKSQSEFTIISREDELTALQQQVDHLTKQLEIKDEIVQNAARDVQELRKIRTAQDLERERLEAQIESQAFQLDQANAEILQTKQDVTDFDRRYRDVATALSVAQARRTSNEPSPTPDIQPAPVASSTPAPKDPNADDFDNLTGEEISDRIMDFRLGLRKDLT